MDKQQAQYEFLIKESLKKITALEDELAAVKQAHSEPLAIIGIGCRFPEADNPAQFWQMLHTGVDAITDVPPERWPINHYYDPDPATPGKMYMRQGGFVKGIDQFDRAFFNIAPREAVSLDPQHRLLMEVSWEALEYAALHPDELVGRQVGVFVGVSNIDYFQALLNRNEQEIDAYTHTGAAASVASGRLAYQLGLKGPTLTVDTACSSSLVAIHLACQSLRNGECEMALAGGVNIILSPEISITLSKARVFSPDGRCKTFDASANGYVRGEGCGIVVLKRLSQAVKDGDNIVAVIRGSAINHDGRTSGLTVPNGPAQQAVIRQALENGAVDPQEVTYIEAHGTGTELGDPIEVNSLGAVFPRSAEQPLIIGSVKTNFGHLEGAAGVAGLIKAALALHHQQIPAHLHFNQPNPHIQWDALSVKIPNQTMPWPNGQPQRIAGVSSFGLSGTNAHIVLAQAPEAEANNQPAGDQTAAYQLLTLSAKSEAGLTQLATAYAHHLVENPTLSPADVCYTAGAGRAQFKHRLAVVAASTAEFSEKLRHLHQERPPAGLLQGQLAKNRQPKIAFLFTGQGAQYVDMARRLYDTRSEFRQILDDINDQLQVVGGDDQLSLLDILYPSNTASPPTAQTLSIDDTAITQPALFSVEYALAKLWQSWGITPTVMMGHSVGEYAAACIAGVFSLADGLKLIAARGRLMQSLPKNGQMVAVLADEAQVAAALAPYAQSVSIAAINGPRNVVISGQSEAIAALVEQFAAQNLKTIPLNTSHAFHSPLMDPILAEFEQIAANISYHAPQLKLVSNVSGALAGPEISSAAYWVQHIRQAVRFAPGVDTLHRMGINIYLEIGPQPTLLGMARRCLDDSSASSALWLPSLHPKRPDGEQLLTSLSHLYLQDAAINWPAVTGSRQKVILPTYPFQRTRYWFTGQKQIPAQITAPHSSATAGGHPLLGQQLRVAGPKNRDIIFETTLSPEQPAYLGDHRIFDKVVVPATAYLEMALAAARRLIPAQPVTLEALHIQQALILSGATPVQLIITPPATPEEPEYHFEIFSLSDVAAADWTRHCAGQFRPAVIDTAAPNLSELQSRLTTAIDVDAFYHHFQNQGISYGPTFKLIDAMWHQDDATLGQITLPAPALLNTGSYHAHPALLDACLQPALAALQQNSPNATFLPVEIGQVTLFQPLQSGPIWSHAHTTAVTPRAWKATVHLFAADGSLLARISGLHLQQASLEAVLGQQTWRNWLYQPTWVKDEAEQGHAREITHPILILADDGGLGRHLADTLTAQGQRPILAFAGDSFAQTGPDEFTLSNTPADFEQLLQAVPAGQNIVHLWSLNHNLQNLDAPALQQAALTGCGSVLHLVQALAERPANLWLVTRGAQAVAGWPGVTAAVPGLAQAPLWGMGRSIVLEQPQVNVTQIDLDPNPVRLDPHESDTARLLAEIQTDAPAESVAFRQQSRYVARLRHLSTPDDESTVLPFPGDNQPYQLHITERGRLDNMTLQPAKRQPPQTGQVEIRVYATGLNFKDILNVQGLYPGDPGPLGGECAGEIVAVGPNVANFQVGDKVTAFATGSFSQYVTVNSQLVAHIGPTSLTFAEAATIPVTFLTAYYCLHHMAHISAGDRVLIHAASGGVGQAAVQLALQAGAEVFGTAGPAKMNLLKEMGVRHVYNSRTLDFATRIMADTQNQGVDIVLNSLTGEGFIEKSLSTLAHEGTFVEIGKRNVLTPAQMQQTRPDVAYHLVDLLDVADQQPALIETMFRAIMGHFAADNLRPLLKTLFPIEQAVSAFRYMQQAKHTGKIVITHPRHPAAGQPISIRAEATYVITGGLGGLGLRLARWLADQGAKHLLLLGRSEPNAIANIQLEAIRQSGVAVTIAQADVSVKSHLAQALSQIDPAHPLGGVIHSAGVVNDKLLSRQDWAGFAQVLSPKVEGAWHLHELTKSEALDFFVMFSSMAALLGNSTQTNYAAANAFLDALAAYRQAQGLPAQSINWGTWAEVGMTANDELLDYLAAIGFESLSPAHGLAALAHMLPTQRAQVGIAVINWELLIPNLWPAGRPPFLSLLDGVAQADAPPASLPQPATNFISRLTGANLKERWKLLRAYVRREISDVLGFTQGETLDLNEGFFELGLDSLTAMELRSRLQSGVQHSLPATLTFDYPTGEDVVQYLAEHIFGDWFMEDVAPAEPEAPAETPIADKEPIAVIGLGCRFPGANNPTEFWQLLQNGLDATSEIPANRWDIEAFYDPDPDTPGKMNTRRGGFVDRIEEFDPHFFGISPREARSLDPQQRLLLEVTWEAVEQAGLPADSLLGSETGVFIGIVGSDYAQRLSHDPGQIDAYLATGTVTSVASGRLAYTLGLQGPAVSIDTACSSSLVAVHQACQSLQQAECNMAVAGGVSLILSPDWNINFSKAKMLAPDGHCKTFDAAADGYVRGEGCGVVVLKRLSAAEADGDNILAVIHGSAVNHDGRTSGLTVPNGPAQQAVIRRALQAGQLTPAQVSYIEAHGTGTSLGDPIEVAALGEVFAAGRETPLWVGSVKTNFGHLEGSAGIAGLIKVVLSLHHGEIPPHLHFKTPSPHIDWADLPIKIPTKPTPWPDTAAQKVAGVSSFGISGTNAHIVLAEKPAQLIIDSERPTTLAPPDHHLLVLSAKTKAALTALAARYEAYLLENPTVDIADVCYTTGAGRAHFAHRLTLTTTSVDEVREKLAQLRQGKTPAGLARSDGADSPASPTDELPQVAFLFTGQGSQYVGMARDLYHSEPLFRQILDDINRQFSEQVAADGDVSGEEISLLDVLYPTDLIDSQQLTSKINETAYTQPALFAIEVALARLWQAWGIEPDVVMGHSVGEYAAACIAGVFSLEDGLKLITERGRLMQSLPQNGKMVVVLADSATVSAALAPYQADVTLAAINGPKNVVISGRTEAVDSVVAQLSGQNIRTTPLTTSHAFHSPLMTPIVDQFEQFAAQITYHAPKIKLVSNLTGAVATDDVATAAYWAQHIRRPVQFATGAEILAQLETTVFIEIGPNPVLLGMARRCLDGTASHTLWLPSLRAGQPDWKQLLDSLGRLYTRGFAINWSALTAGQPRQKISLPTYPFQRKRYWVDAPTPVAVAAAQAPWQDWLYQLEWQPHWQRPLTPDYLPEPAHLKQAVSQSASNILARTNLDTFAPAVANLDKVSIGYIIRAIQTMGVEFEVGQQWPTGQLADRLGVAAKFRPLLAHYLSMLAAEGILTHQNDSWQVRRSPAPPDIDQELEAIARTYGETIALELAVFKKCGEHMADILRGEVDTISLLFPDGDLGPATRLYQDAPAFVVVNSLMRQTLISALDHTPPGAKIRILEIGAGTGATTSHLLPYLNPGQTEYVFTDISAMFTSKAQQRFADYPFISYQVLDIEQAPLAQGFQPGQFDVIIAANVIHATQNLTETLANIKQVLAPNGLLLFLESTSHQRWADVAFGGIDGWWRFKDFETRPDHPLLTGRQWQQLLLDCDFAATETITLPQLDGHLSIIVAQNQPAQPPHDDHWLILADEQGVADQLAGRLQQSGHICTLVKAGDSFKQVADGQYQTANRVADFERLLEAASPTGGIINLWSLDNGDVSEEANLLGCGAMLHLLQATVRKNVTAPLWLITRGAQAVTQSDTVPGLAHAALWGMGKAISEEHPDLPLYQIDLAPDPTPIEGETLFRQIFTEADPLTPPAPQIALRREMVYQPRLSQQPPHPQPLGLTFSAEQSYLIVGGLGGVGLLVARWLVTRGARHLILMGRSGAGEAAQPRLQALRNIGATIHIAQADVTNREQLQAVVDGIDPTHPLRGVIHAAVVGDSHLLLQQAWASFERVLAPKVQGAWNLHQVTRDLPLEFFVLFSSSTAWFEADGLVSYAAANTFLDALAHYRQAQGLAGQSINWGRWAETSSTTVAQISRHIERKKLGDIPLNQALAALENILLSGSAQTGVIPTDWPALEPRLLSAATQSLLAEVIAHSKQAAAQQTLAALPASAAPAAPTQPAEPAGLPEQLAAAPQPERYDLLRSYLRREIGTVLGFEANESVDLHAGFFEMGLDSLISMELRNRLQNGTQRSLPSTLTFDYPTGEQVVQYLAKEHFADLFTAADSRTLPPRTVTPTHAAHSEEIAIVGLSCRFPGGSSADEFWQTLRQGQEALKEVPPERWNLDDYFDPDPETPGKMYMRRAGFIDDVDQFDSLFFGISPKEARGLDPQQRLLLEVGWEALENAGIAPDSLMGSKTGVFVGIIVSDYGFMVLSQDASEIDAYLATGISLNGASGRLAYVLGLHGPALSIDTACSSSLVAIHQACQSIRNGECEMALAGGVNLILSPTPSINLSKAKMLSPSGHCKTFDAEADGFVRGEGCGIIVLKPLSAAMADGDNILAVIKGTAINHDGRTSGFTVPNGPAQQAVIQQALANSDLTPAQVSYVEAHGTATSLGDPIEANALGDLFADPQRTNPLLIGSVKANVGHLEASAGVAGVIKVALALHHQEIPPHINFKTPSPHINWAEMPLQVPTDPTAWPDEQAQKIAGVSSFGVSGTNAHVILAAAPERDSSPWPGESGPENHLFILSAKTEAALDQLAARYQAYLAEQPAAGLADICYTAAAGRSHFHHRLSIQAASTAELAEKLAQIRGGQTPAAVLSATLDPTERLKIAFVCTGQDAGLLEIARQLYETQPTFQRILNDLSEQLVINNNQDSLLDILCQDDATAWADSSLACGLSPLALVVGYALGKLWQAWGIEPDMVLGDGPGEIVAACIAGILSLPDALKLATATNAQLEQVAAGLTYAAPKIKVVSSCNGAPAADEIQTPAYWSNLAGQPARLTEAVANCRQLGAAIFLPIGQFSTDAAQPAETVWLSSPVATKPVSPQLLNNLAQLYTHGVALDWARFHQDYGRQKVSLPTYPFQRQRHWITPAPDTSRQQWFYQVEWQIQPPIETAPLTAGHWLILADALGLGQQLANRLTAAGHTCVLVSPGETFAQLEADSLQIPNTTAGFEQLLTNQPPLKGIIHLWGLNGAVDNLAQANQLGCGSMLHLLQALLKKQSFAPLWLVTQGAQAVNNTDPVSGLAQAALWGMGRAIREEHPYLALTQVDLEPQAPLDAARLDQVETLLTAATPLYQVALRGQRLFTPRLVRQANSLSQNGRQPALRPTLNDTATYLIVGGLGGVGLSVAEWLVKQGARHLLLMSRSGRVKDKNGEERLQALKSTGAAIHVAQADVSDPAQVRAALAQIEAAHPLRGVIHAAAVIDDRLLAQQDWAGFERVLRPKVQGAWNLHLATAEIPLDFFILFSSTAALFGNAGGANYAAANAFLDSLAHFRQNRGLAGQSLNWGAWANTGLAASAQVQERLRRMGSDQMTPPEAVQALGQAMSQNAAQLVITPINWAKIEMNALPGATTTFFEALTTPADSADAPAPAMDISPETLLSLPAAEQTALLERYTHEQLSRVLGLSAGQIDRSLPLSSLGIDSLMAIELRNQFMNQLKVEIPLETFFGEQNLDALLAVLQSQLALLAGVLKFDDSDDEPDSESEVIFL